MLKIKSKCKRGFTLTEVLVVVLIISVLAAIVYPMYTKVITKSRAVEAINLLEMVRGKQLQKFARDKSYYTVASGLGQLTSNSADQTSEGTVIKVKDYTLSLNADKSCMTASYVKHGQPIFTFSSSYERSGLGCTGDICTSFGNIIGTSKDVCNCGNKTCGQGETLDEDSCECKCFRGCSQGGKCFDPYGGGSTRPCASGCGTESSVSSCSGPVWTGSCAATYLKEPTSQACGNGGTQTRNCTPSCSGGTCDPWGPCTGNKTACPSSCAAGEKRNPSVVNQEDGACCVAKTSCPSSCPAGQKRNASVSYTEDGSCCIAQTACPATCEAGKQRNPAVNYTEQGECCIAAAKTACPASCPAGQKRNANINYTEDGPCCSAKTECSATCPNGQERDTTIIYADDGSCCKAKSCDPAKESACTGSAGTWDASGCSCTCNSPRVLTGNTCACPTETPYEYSGKCNQCPQSQYITNGKCCPKDQVSLDGKKCVYAYKPEQVSVGILADCHNTYSYINKSTCRRTGAKSYFIGGKLPTVTAGDRCTVHHAYYNGGYWWEGGEHQGYSLPMCYTSDYQTLCDNNCYASSCTYKCVISESVPETCGVYTCSNGPHCDNNSGSGRMMRCVRK